MSDSQEMQIADHTLLNHFIPDKATMYDMLSQ